MITHEQAGELLIYEPETGLLKWRVARHGGGKVGGIRAGQLAGHRDSKGYMVVWICGRSYKSHRVAWLIVHGDWPEKHLDHIDGNPMNNRIANLREITPAANAQNQRRAHRDSRTGLLGVSPDRGRFVAMIKHEGALKYLGSFGSPEAAHEVYLAAKRKLHEGCSI